MGKKEKRKITEPKENAQKMLMMAKSDLSVAQGGKIFHDVNFETLCGLCHQAIEKSLKSLTIWNNGYYYYDHSIINLIDEMEKQKIRLPEEIKSAALGYVTISGGFSFPLKFPMNFGTATYSSDYSGNRRYHLPDNPTPEQDYIRFLERASKIVNWVEQQMR